MKILVVKRNSQTGLVGEAYVAMSGGTHQSAKLCEAVKLFNQTIKELCRVALAERLKEESGARRQSQSDLSPDRLRALFDMLVAEILKTDPSREAEAPITLLAAYACLEEDNMVTVHRFLYRPGD